MIEKDERRKQYLDYDGRFEEMMEDIKNDEEWYPETYRDVFLLAACYAVKRNLEPVKIQADQKNQQKQIRISEVIKEHHRIILRLIAFHTTNNIESLRDDNEVYEIAETYANAGLLEIFDHYYKRVDSPSFKFAEIALS